MGNNPSCSTNTWNKPASCMIACCARMLGKSNMVLCHTEIHSCHWHIPIDDGQLCAHPSSQQIVHGILPTGWSAPATDIC
jgi:NADH pyrophosphatase NudC (nudix superfamily)